MLDRTIWWHVYPLAALGAPIRETPDTAHRLRALEPWLDYLVELGCNGLLLGPIFASATHGYDTLDHFRIDPRLGDDEDFDWLIDACRQRGVNLMLDGVFNHVARSHPWVASGLAGDTDWEGHGELATLNHDDPRVHDAVAEIMLHWLRRGIAGWRLDVAYAVPPEFWRTVLARVREEFPDAMFLGEVIHGDYAEIARAGTLDAVTQYELWKATWSSLVDANFWELAHALERHPTDVLPNTFIGNHDVDRIASTVGPEKVVLAAAVLLTVPGMPSIYYGDEQGFTGVRGEGWSADDSVRPVLPAELSPLGAWIYDEYRELIALRRRQAWLTHSQVEVLHKTNETISYRCVSGENSLQVDLWLDPAPGVRVHAGGEELYSWMWK